MKTKLLGVVASLAFLATASAAYADLFNVSGTFDDGGTLTGLLDLDASMTPTRGTLLARTSLSITPGPGSITATSPIAFIVSPPDPNFGPGFLTAGGDTNYGAPLAFTVLHLTFNFTTILSGSISWPQECITDPSGTHCVGGTTANIASGTLTKTPLPGALPLFATGLGALGLLGWRRKRKASTHKRVSGITGALGSGTD